VSDLQAITAKLLNFCVKSQHSHDLTPLFCSWLMLKRKASSYLLVHNTEYTAQSASVWHAGTFLVCSKAYCHFFSKKLHSAVELDSDISVTEITLLVVSV